MNYHIVALRFAPAAIFTKLFNQTMLALRERTVIDVSFEIKGEEVQPENMKDVLDILFLKHIRKKINDSIGSIQCSEHGKQASVLVKGKNIDTLLYEISGCCEELVKKVKKKIK